MAATLFVEPTGLFTERMFGSIQTFPVLMYAARCMSARMRSIAERICISADAMRVSSWNEFDASRDSATTASATMTPADIEMSSSTSVNPRARLLRFRELMTRESSAPPWSHRRSGTWRPS